MKLTKNFSKREFDSKDGAEMPLEVLQNIKKLAENLQVLRDELKAPITVNSGYRSLKHNAKIGGAKKSQHLLGNASDIVVYGYTPQEVAIVIEELIRDGKMLQGGLKAYDTFTHYDIYFDGKNIRRW
jgi:uncharacterized protein YcbK (DUF882 family)